MSKKDDDILVFPLDVDSLDEAIQWMERLGEVVRIYKIGYQLFLREGMAAVEAVHKAGFRVFLDLKLHDIPHTIYNATRQIVRSNVFMFNVHACGGREMMEAAARASVLEAEKSDAVPPLILGVTVLTSLDNAEANEVGLMGTTNDLVIRLAKLSRTCGLSGVVSSPEEAAVVRQATGTDFTIVCPGVRFDDADAGDHHRSASPQAAVAAGADYLVAGRPIRHAEDPLAQAMEIDDLARKAREKRDREE